MNILPHPNFPDFLTGKLSPLFDRAPDELTIDPDRSGYCWEPLPVIGGRAGPSVCITNAMHEIAHIIERDEPRLYLSWNCGLRIKSYQEIGGRRYYEARTTQHIHRELRTWAIQENMDAAFGLGLLENQAEAHVLTADYLPDIFLLDAEAIHPDYEVREKVPYRERKPMREAHMLKVLAQYREEYPIDVIMERWNTRMVKFKQKIARTKRTMD